MNKGNSVDLILNLPLAILSDQYLPIKCKVSVRTNVTNTFKGHRGSDCQAAALPNKWTCDIIESDSLFELLFNCQ